MDKQKVKPILIIGYPGPSSTKEYNQGYEKLKGLTENEYHIILYINNDLDCPTFQAVYNEDIMEKDIQEIKELVLNHLK